MPHYLFQASYTPETWAKLIKQPEDRADAAKALIESLGGRLEVLYFAFGDDDLVALFEMPDNVQAAALAVAISASGTFRSAKTTVLMTSQEAKQVMQRANAAVYRPPGQ